VWVLVILLTRYIAKKVLMGSIMGQQQPQKKYVYIEVERAGIFMDGDA
jgi:hypothetical protein